MKRLGVATVISLVILSGGCSSDGDTPSSTSTSSAKNDEITVAAWLIPARPYGSKTEQSLNQIGTDGTRQDIPNLKTHAGELADNLRSFRLALESAGDPPASATVEARALIEASATAETAARSLSACVIEQCLASLQTFQAAVQSFTSALSAVNAKR